MKRGVLTVLAITALMMVGCAKKKMKPAGTDVPPVVDPTGGTGTGAGFGGGGATAELVFSSVSAVSDYSGGLRNNPTGGRISIDLVKLGSGYGGTVKVSYSDDATGSPVTHEGSFSSFVPDNFLNNPQIGPLVKDDATNNKYNIWFIKNGQLVWHGFFEDQYGGIIVVIDEVIDLGDGGGVEDLVSGSVWFKNFGDTFAPKPPTSCWFISGTPYDCRAWPSGDGVNTTDAINPNNGYRKLGEFLNLSVSEAFNGELNL